MAGFFKKLFSPPPWEKEAEVTLSGLRVRADNETKKIIPWHQLKGPRDTSGSSYTMRIVDNKGQDVQKDGKPQTLRIKGGREARLCRRAYIRGLKRAMQSSDLVFEVFHRKTRDFLVISILLMIGAAFFLYHGGYAFPGKMLYVLRSTNEPGNLHSPELIIVTNIIVVLAILLFASVALFLAWVWYVFAVQFYRTKKMTSDVHTLQFSSQGLTCIQEKGLTTFHSWNLLITKKTMLGRFRFVDGFVVYLPTDCRTLDLARAVYNLHSQPAKSSFRKSSLALSIMFWTFFLLAIYGGLDYFFKAVDVDNVGLSNVPKWPIMVVSITLISGALSVSLLETKHPAIKRISRRFQRWTERAKRKPECRRQSE